MVEKTSELFDRVLQKAEGKEEMSFAELVDSLEDGGFALLLILFSAPTALPLPAIPGLTFILSLPVLILSMQMIIGLRSPRLPGFLGRKKYNPEILRQAIPKINKILSRMERFIRPRFSWMASKGAQHIVGICALICGLSVALPLPLTNTIPSMGIVLFSLGFLEKDGALVAVGVLVGLLGVTIAGSAMYFGAEAVKSWLGG